MTPTFPLLALLGISGLEPPRSVTGQASRRGGAGPDPASHTRPVRPGQRPKLGRNVRCHCGSGRKYKSCCRPQDTGAA